MTVTFDFGLINIIYQCLLILKYKQYIQIQWGSAHTLLNTMKSNYQPDLSYMLPAVCWDLLFLQVLTREFKRIKMIFDCVTGS